MPYGVFFLFAPTGSVAVTEVTRPLSQCQGQALCNARLASCTASFIFQNDTRSQLTASVDSGSGCARPGPLGLV